GEMEPVQQLPLGENLGLGRIEILGLACAEQPSAEAGRTSHRVADGEHESSAHARTDFGLTLTTHQQARSNEALVAHAESMKMAIQGRRIARREAEFELFQQRSRNLSPGQVFPGLTTLRLTCKLATVPLRSRSERLTKRFTRIVLLSRCGNLANLYSNSFGNQPDGICEGQAEVLAEEGENISANAALEAVIEALLG